MREKILLRIGSRKLHLVKLIGAFIVVGAGLMLLKHIYNMVAILSVVTGPAGQVITVNFYGLALEKVIESLDVGAKVGLFLAPFAGVMFWAAVLAFGAVIYRTGGITIPITEEVKKIKSASSDSFDGSGEGVIEKDKGGKGQYVCPECGRSFGSSRGLHIHESKSH